MLLPALRAACCALVVAVGVARTAPAAAYVLPTESLLRFLAETRRGTSPRDVTLQLDADLAGHDHPVEERLYFKRPERARLVSQDDTAQVVVERDGAVAGGEDRALKAQAGFAPNLLAWLLVPRGRDLDEVAGRLGRGLASAGIDPTVVSMGRQGEAVAYIIGARPWENERPQLWLDKVTFAPIRVVQQGRPGDGGPFETRLLDYGGGPAGAAWPRVIETYVGGVRQRRAEVNAVQLNQDLPDTLFDLGQPGAGRRR